ncbi:hypothetical protein ABIE61_003706 [Marinobacterium sp. MBR-111]|jgi:hypothetical protein
MSHPFSVQSKEMTQNSEHYPQEGKTVVSALEALGV